MHTLPRPDTAPASPLPGWLDRAQYPFRPRRLETAQGALSYVDEGSGPTVVLVHGTPTWSFLWRRVIRHLAAGHRVIAPDHLGFGLSDKPRDGAYAPADHARRLGALLDALDVRDVTLVAHDFGGPIALAWALDHRERLARLALCNTWAWSLDGDPRIARGARLAASALGRLLYTRLNASPRLLIPASVADRRALARDVHRQYLAPFPDAASREAPWALARALLGAGAWYDALWARRGELAEVPALLAWGMRDPTFGAAYLARWREALPHAAVAEIAGSGHFVPEEAPDALARALDGLLARPIGPA
jgi:pimeloyl-ACP methyl ester carboxylesterase